MKAFSSTQQKIKKKDIILCRNWVFNAVWGLEKFRFFCTEKVHLPPDQQDIELLIACGTIKRQNTARIMKWFDRLSHFDLSINQDSVCNLAFIG